MLSKTSDGPSFEDWLGYCFDNPHDEDIDTRFHLLQPILLSDWLIRLLSESDSYQTALPSECLARGIWFIFGVGSEYMREFRHTSVNKLRQGEVVLSMRNLYQNVFDKVADQGGKRPASSTNDFNDLDGSIYMIWDMNGLEGAAMFPGEEHLIDPIFRVLEAALQCRTVACQIGGLHGLGHLQPHHPKRVAELIDRFTSRKRTRMPWVVQYASQARKGMVE